MDTESDKLFRSIIGAYSRLAPSMREQVVWRMNLDTFKAIAMSRVNTTVGPVLDIPPIHLMDKIPDGTQLLGMPVEEHASSEILLVMKVA
jgi:hypothetical protein